MFEVEEAVSGVGVSKVKVQRKGWYAHPPRTIRNTISSRPCPTDPSDQSGVGCTLQINYVTPAVPQDAKSAYLSALAQDIRWRDDGIDPTATTGKLLIAGEAPFLYTGDLSKIRFIQAAEGAILNVEYCNF